MISDAGTENSIKEMIPETKGSRDDNNKNESRKAWTMEMLMNGFNNSTNTASEEESRRKWGWDSLKRTFS